MPPPPQLPAYVLERLAALRRPGAAGAAGGLPAGSAAYLALLSVLLNAQVGRRGRAAANGCGTTPAKRASAPRPRLAQARPVVSLKEGGLEAAARALRLRVPGPLLDLLLSRFYVRT